MQLNCLIFILMSEEKLYNDSPSTTNYKLVADWAKSRICFLGQSQKRCFKQSKVIQLNWAGKFFFFLHSFRLLLYKFNLLKGDWGLGCVFSQMWIFSTISQFPEFKVVLQFKRQLMYLLCYARYQVCFYLFQFDPVF